MMLRTVVIAQLDNERVKSATRVSWQTRSGPDCHLQRCGVGVVATEFAACTDGPFTSARSAVKPTDNLALCLVARQLLAEFAC